jgi:hypothetical protein
VPFSAPMSWYPTSGLSTHVSLCVAPSDALPFSMACELEEVDHFPSLSSRQINGVRIERDRGDFLFPLAHSVRSGL